MDLPPPDTKVLAFQEEDDNISPIIAVYLPRFYRELDYEDDEVNSEYNYGNDTYYWASGWYECVQNWGDFSYLRVVPQCNLISWQPINYPT